MSSLNYYMPINRYGKEPITSSDGTNDDEGETGDERILSVRRRPLLGTVAGGLSAAGLGGAPAGAAEGSRPGAGTTDTHGRIARGATPRDDSEPPLGGGLCCRTFQ